MSVASMLKGGVGALSVVTPGTEDNFVLKALLEMVGMMSSGVVMQKLSIPEMLGALTGKLPAPPGLIKAATFIAKMGANPLAKQAVVPMILGALSTKGISADGLLSLVQKVSPLVEVPPPEDMEGVFNALSTLADRVLSFEGNVIYKPAAICICPKCSHVYGIGVPT